MTQPAGIDPRLDPPTFTDPAEARAFALAVKLHEAGHFTWTEWAATLSARIAEAPDAPYYDRWMAALETLVARKGLA